MESLIRIAFDETFSETLDRMPELPADMCLGEKIYEFSYLWFLEGLRAGVEIVKKEEDE